MEGVVCEDAFERMSKLDLGADDVLDEATEADSGEGEKGEEA